MLLHAIYVAWRVLVVIVCLLALATSLVLLIEERNTSYLFGLGFGIGAFYAGRDLLT